MITGDQVEIGGLPGPVGSDDGMDIAGPDGKTHAIGGQQFSENFD